MPAGLCLRGVGKARSANVTVLRDIDIEIAPGEVVAFLGASGSGKSTLLEAVIAGLDELTAGRIDGDIDRAPCLDRCDEARPARHRAQRSRSGIRLGNGVWREGDRDCPEQHCCKRAGEARKPFHESPVWMFPGAQ